jgi:RNA polymerase sigma-70 factor (ECF subfamily)
VTLRLRWLGSVPYREAHALQQALFERSADDHLLLLEHPHVYTLGVRADLANVLVPPASVGADLVRRNLCAEAIRLGRTLAELMPDEPEAVGLLALMLLHDARREGRVDPGSGDLIPLEEQDRSSWDRARIDEGTALLESALRRRQPGPYQVQAAIAARHADAAAAADTDWVEIAGLYRELARMVPTPIVELNRAVAVAMAHGPAAGLKLVSALESSGQLAGYHLLAASRADLLRRSSRWSDAAAAYRVALDQAPTDAERRFLSRRLVEVEAASLSS